MWGNRILSILPTYFFSWSLITLFYHLQGIFTTQPAMAVAAAVMADCTACLPTTQKTKPERDAGAGRVNSHRTAALLQLFVVMDRDTEPRLWIVKFRLGCRMPHGKIKEAIQVEERDVNIYHSRTLTKNKPWQQPAMHCLVYANLGCSDQKHNKLSTLLNPMGSDS